MNLSPYEREDDIERERTSTATSVEWVERGETTVQVAGELLKLSMQQTRRLLATHRDGATGLAHGNRDRESPRRVPEATSAEILRLARTQHIDYNDQYLTEELGER